MVTREWPGFRQAMLLCAIAAIPAGATALWHPRRATRSIVQQALAPHGVEPATVAAWSQRILWLDARPESDFRQSHIPGALPLDEAQWERDLPAVLEAWQPEMRVVVYCAEQGCGTSERVARRLRQDLGHEEVYFLRGGYEAWQTAQK